MAFIPRPSQAKILKYQGGKLGISAVPGSGKTHTLSALAAVMVEKILNEYPARNPDDPDTEILIVTFSNAAVSNFSARISGFLAERGLVPGIGYRVRTLHGMASDIVRPRAEAFGIDPDFTILDESSSNLLIRRAVDLWLAEDQGRTLSAYLKDDISDDKREKDINNRWIADVTKIAGNVISQAKDYQLTPGMIRAKLSSMPSQKDFLLLQMFSSIYDRYQKQLQSYPAFDFADLMFTANRILENDPVYLQLLQQRWPVILEDEAQDSSMIQEKVLRLLTAKTKNWVRVGDPNQAINETFTTADPKFLKDFLQEADQTVDLAHSGRSTVSILKLANQLIQWTSESHPTENCRTALVKPYIRSTAANDPQSNPKDEPKRVFLDKNKYTSAEEIRTISELAARHAMDHPEETIAILVPINAHGENFVDELKNYPVDVIEVLKSVRSTRYTADQIAKVLHWLSLPQKKEYCLQVFESIYNPAAEEDFYLSPDDSKIAKEKLESIEHLEDFFYPDSAKQFEQKIQAWNISEMIRNTLFSFRYFLKKWLDARNLRIDQIILLIAQDLYSDPGDLSIANQLGKIALQMTQADAKLQLDEIAGRIRDAASNSALYPGLNGVEAQFDPNLYRGKIVITTFHKAKGLEWDQVETYLRNTILMAVEPTNGDRDLQCIGGQPY